MAGEGARQEPLTAGGVNIFRMTSLRGLLENDKYIVPEMPSFEEYRLARALSR